MSKDINFPNLTEFLGWNGTFVLVTIVIFKILLGPLGASGCPCTGHVVYGSVMLGLPALSIFLVAFFGYFYQDDTKQPWKYLKAYFRLKKSCNYSLRSREWELHSGNFHQCAECQGKWSKIKITVSFYVSWVYSMLWLALGFRQITYYACANVGPDPNGILDYCDNWKNIDDKYEKRYKLAVFKSYLIGNVLLVVVICLVSVIFITYRSMKRRIDAHTDFELEEEGHIPPSHTPINNFARDNETLLGTEQIPGAQVRMGATPRTEEGASPVGSKQVSYEGFREQSGDMSRSRTSPMHTQPLITVDG